MSGMYNKRNKIKSMVRCIASVVLAALLIIEPSMLVFAESEEPEADITDQTEAIQDDKDAGSGQKEPADTAGNTGSQKDHSENQGNDEDPQPDAIDKEEARDALQPGSGRKASAQLQDRSAGDDGDAADDGSEDGESEPIDEITVTVQIKNETYPVSKGAPWDGTLIDTQVTIPSDYTMMQALHKVCQDNDIPSRGTDGSYVSMIKNLQEFDGGGGSGWMGTLNDWFVNTGFDGVSLHDDDVISIEYTCALGEDLGSSFTDRDKRVKALSTSIGELAPEFDSDHKEYNLIVPVGTDSVSIYTTAVNRNYLVKSIAGGKEYNRGTPVPIEDGAVILVRCGDQSWPSMNSYGEEDTVKPVTYKINVYEGDPRFLADVSGVKCVPELDRESGIYAAGEKVTVTLRYNRTKYQLSEDGVRAYVGGSSKFIQLTDEGDDTYSFTMPGNNVEVRAKCVTRPEYPLSVTGSLTGCTMTTDHSDGKYYRGEKVTFTLTPESGKRINDLSVRAEEKDSGDALELEHVSQDKYSFTMPEEDVKVYAESEDKVKNGLKGYTIKTKYGNVSGKLTDASRTSICDLPERATEFDFSLDIDKSETLTAVRIKDITGSIKTYTEPNMTGVSVGTRNMALLGKELTATVLTEDTAGKAHTYTIRIKTKKCTTNAEAQDALILPYKATDDLLPYRKSLMTSGVTLYEVDYPTTIKDYIAQDATVGIAIFPTYEEKAESIEIRCKYTAFTFVESGGVITDSRWYYQSNTKIRVRAGETLDIPIEIDFTLESGEIITRKYLYRVTNGRYAKQKFKVLTSAGNPMVPQNLSIDNNRLKVSDLKFNEGCFELDFAPGEYIASTMGKQVGFSVPDELQRPIETDTIVIQTDTPEYRCSVSCSDGKAVFSIIESSTGADYYNKSSEKVFSLPPGSYVLKAYNENTHRYSRKAFVITENDVSVNIDPPYLMDPLYVVDQLNLLEEIQSYYNGDGRLKVYVPDYQTGTIRVVPILVETDGPNMYKVQDDYVSYYYVDRDSMDHTVKIKYEVYNEIQYSQTEPEKYYTDVMELYVPALNEGQGETPQESLPPAGMLRLGFGIEDGSVICGLHFSQDEYGKSQMVGSAVPIVDESGSATIEQLFKAGYKIKYTMRYSENSPDTSTMTNIGIRELTGLYSGTAIAISDDLPLAVFETRPLYDSIDAFGSVDPSVNNWGTPDYEKDGYYEITSWIEDKSGGKSEPRTITVYKDGRSPGARVAIDHTEGVYTSEQKEPQYVNEAVTVTVSANDAGTGLHEYAYSFDGGETWRAGNTITFDESGKVDINDIWVRDSMGNIGTASGGSFDADLYSDPTGARYWGYGGAACVRWADGDTDSKIRYLYVDAEYPYVGVVSSFDPDGSVLSLIVNATDQVSGLADEAYSFDGGETWQSSNKFTIVLGEYRADNIRVRDKAGNITTYDDEYVWTADSCSDAGPVIKSVKVDYGKGGGTGYDGRRWYQSATVTINAEAGDSEITGYSIDGQHFEKANTISIDAGRLIKAGQLQVIDKAGNVAVYDQSIDITNIDTKAPNIDKFSFGPNVSYPVKELKISIGVTDDLSRGLQYAVTALPIEEYRRGYPPVDLKLEWADSFDDDQFKVSNIGKKYDRDTLITGGKILNIMPAKDRPNVWGIRMWAKDAAGNISYFDTCTQGEYVDQTGPDISEVTTEYKRFNDASGIVKVYVAATEPKYGAGLAAKAYSFDGGKTWQASNSTSIPIGATIAAGQIKVRDQFGNISTYNKVVKTTLQDVITRINRLDPRKAKDKDYKEIIDLFNQLSDREKKKVYNWQKFLDMMGNRQDQDWDDDYGDIGEPDNGDEHGGDDDDHGGEGDHSSGDGGNGSDGGEGNHDGKPTDGEGGGEGGVLPDSENAGGGNDADTVNIALSDASTSSVPEAKAKAGQSYREAEIDKVGGGGFFQNGIVKPWELLLLILIVLGAYTYGASRRFRRYREEI